MSYADRSAAILDCRLGHLEDSSVGRVAVGLPPFLYGDLPRDCVDRSARGQPVARVSEVVVVLNIRQLLGCDGSCSGPH